MDSSFRLIGGSFSRDTVKENPKKIFFLSVEGDCTEKCYFERLNKKLDNSIIQVEVLNRKKGDGFYAPEQVLELLEEYLQLREGDIIPADIKEIAFENHFNKNDIQNYFNNKLTKKEKNKLENQLMTIGFDISYRKYLKNLHGDDDCFAIVIDRDNGNHDKEMLKKCINKANEKGYKFFMTNPCFEFWLLLHLSDVKNEYANNLDNLLKNEKKSNKHTYVSKEVSEKAGHKKNISQARFDEYYYPNINLAMQRANDFDTNLEKLLDNIGTNIPELIQKLK